MQNSLSGIPENIEGEKAEIQKLIEEKNEKKQANTVEKIANI